MVRVLRYQGTNTRVRVVVDDEVGRLIGLLAVSDGLGRARRFGFGPHALVSAMALVMTYIEGTPHHAAHALGMPAKLGPKSG